MLVPTYAYIPTGFVVLSLSVCWIPEYNTNIIVWGKHDKIAKPCDIYFFLPIQISPVKFIGKENLT